MCRSYIRKEGSTRGIDFSHREMKFSRVIESPDIPDKATSIPELLCSSARMARPGSMLLMLFPAAMAFSVPMFPSLRVGSITAHLRHPSIARMCEQSALVDAEGTPSAPAEGAIAEVTSQDEAILRAAKIKAEYEATVQAEKIEKGEPVSLGGPAAPIAPAPTARRVAIGDVLPDVIVEPAMKRVKGKFVAPKALSVRDALGSGTSILVGMPGAFTPVCNDQHLPGLFEIAPRLAALNVSRLAVVTTNDRFVNAGWAESVERCSGKNASGVDMLSDSRSAHIAPGDQPRLASVRVPESSYAPHSLTMPSERCAGLPSARRAGQRAGPRRKHGLRSRRAFEAFRACG